MRRYEYYYYYYYYIVNRNWTTNRESTWIVFHGERIKTAIHNFHPIDSFQPSSYLLRNKRIKAARINRQSRGVRGLSFSFCRLRPSRGYYAVIHNRMRGEGSHCSCKVEGGACFVHPCAERKGKEKKGEREGREREKYKASISNTSNKLSGVEEK